jgi:cyclase
MAEFRIQQIVPDIYAYTGGICNRGIVSNHGNVLVIDSGINPGEANALRTVVDEQRKGGWLGLFNTHPHLDHFGGNQGFSDVPIIAQQDARTAIVESGAQMLAAMQQRPQVGDMLKDVKITPPSMTFQDKLTVFVGETEVQLLHFGIAHSPSDTVAWLPKTKVLFAGDLLFNEVVPAMPPGGNAANWITALDRLQELGAEYAIPGHGPIQTPAALGNLRTWMDMLYTRVVDAVKNGWDRDTAIERVAEEVKSEAPRANAEERLPAAIGQVYDQVSRDRASL